MDKICKSIQLETNFKFCCLCEAFINPGKRTKLKWELDPVPTIHTSAALEVPSTLPTSSTSRKPPKEREYQKDELAQFGKQDKITNFDDITENHAPDNYQFYKGLQCIVFYNLVFSVTSGFPAVYGAIKIDKELHVELEWCGDPVPLPQWFVKGKKAKL